MNGKFIVVLDETDFGHLADEVELLAEDVNNGVITIRKERDEW